MSLPKPSGGFEWVQAPWGVALRCRPLAATAPHYFSTRQDAPEQTLADALGVGLDALVRLRQVHRADVFVATKTDPDPVSQAGGKKGSRSNFRPEADIAVTDDPSIALSVRMADCVPVLLGDRRTGAVAAIHAGWRGTAAGAVMVAVESLKSTYATNPADVVAAVGPSIGPCCYEVGPDLASHFSSHVEASTWFTPDAKPHLDLWRASRDQLARAGVLPQHIHVAELCTFDHPALFHSYRRDAKHAGRLVAAIRSAPGRTL
jgi:polyphenol oxidase